MISGKQNIGDVELYYEVRGTGYPLLMIMGLTANATWWPPELLDSLAKDFKVITFDNRGAGSSSRTDDSFTMVTMADDAAKLMDALGVDKAHVLGISMGGMIGQELVLKYPDRVNKLILCASAPGGPETVLDPDVITEMVQANQLPPEERQKFTVKVLFTETFVKENPQLMEEYLERLSLYPMDPPYIMRQTEAVMGFSSLSRLSNIKAPALVVAGSEDILLPAANSRLLAAKIPGARLIVLDGIGHAVMADIDNFASMVKEFLEK